MAKRSACCCKILRDVFVPGDRWFRMGDLMRRDPAGFYFSVDRLGDTFRWKGENVSTTEVAAAVCGCPSVLDAVVYRVLVPGQEGRAGMAAITTTEDFDMHRLAAHLQEALPGYARPLFVRICAALEMTGTFKLTKGCLAAEGYPQGSDPVWKLVITALIALSSSAANESMPLRRPPSRQPTDAVTPYTAV
jgi:fatty-acyl-CoA synthase